MTEPSRKKRIEIPALVVQQWLDEWNEIWEPKQPQLPGQDDVEELPAKPAGHFYIFPMDARTLWTLAAVERRRPELGQYRALDVGIQRKLDQDRVDEIREFHHFGYPWSTLKKRDRASNTYPDLRKPGWLPTAVVINIRDPKQKRPGVTVDPEDVVEVGETKTGGAVIRLPRSFSQSDWKPSRSHPIEIIDGQHRLASFEEDETYEGKFEVPVVAFAGLDVRFQAYLFWTINIMPKRIDRSLAYDMYPLLRTQSWLERTEGPSAYREARAQELVSALWAHPASPWRDRINMVGGKVKGRPRMVSQNAWVEALKSSFVRSAKGRAGVPGGLFGDPLPGSEYPLNWGRHEQAAFLIFVWRELQDAVRLCNEEWAQAIRQEPSGEPPPEGQYDPAFASRFTLLNYDQGLRALLQVLNSMYHECASLVNLAECLSGTGATAEDEKAINEALSAIEKANELRKFTEQLCGDLSKYDWRSASAPDLEREEVLTKQAFKGGSGYRLLREELYRHLAETASRREVADTAKRLSGGEDD